VHNQEVLDQAYRTSQDVYLIFGVNKSGEFFGYAKSAFYLFLFYFAYTDVLGQDGWSN
jgi:pilus assembly protein TadC